MKKKFTFLRTTKNLKMQKNKIVQKMKNNVKMQMVFLF